MRALSLLLLVAALACRATDTLTEPVGGSFPYNPGPGEPVPLEPYDLNPEHYARNVPRDVMLSVYFTLPLDTETITPTSLTFECVNDTGTHTIAYTWNYEAFYQLLRIQPEAPLPADAFCTVTFTRAIQSTDGTPMKEEFRWQFWTSEDGGMPG